MVGDPVFLRNRSRLGLRRDHAKLDPSMSIVVMSGAPERRAVAHPRMFFYNIQDLLRGSRCLAHRAGGEADKVPQAEFAGGASPAWIRCRFFVNEGKTQRRDVPGNSSPTGRSSGRRLGLRVGGEGGIRTHDTLSRIPVFETGTFNRSVTSPVGRILPAEDQRAGTIAFKAPM